MAVNKVQLGDETLIDLTSDTATAGDVISGKTFHLASGLQASGSLGTATQSTDGLMSASDKTKLDGIESGATANTGTVTSVTTGAGLTGGTITSSGTIKAKLKSETPSSLAAASKSSETDKEYAVGLDSNGDLSVNVPWENTWRGIQNNLTSSSTTDSLSAAQGKALKTQVDAVKVLKISMSSFSSLPQTISNSKITANHEVINAVLGTPSAQTGNWSVVTAAGSLTISGTISGSTTAVLYLAVPAT